MKTVILDGYAANPGDLSWDWLNEYGEYISYDRTPDELTVERAADADFIIINKTPLRADTLKQLKKLKYIGLLSTGFNVVDWEYCRDNGIAVCNVPDYSTAAVAQCAFAHILEFTNRVCAYSKSVHSGDWAKSADFSYHVAPLYELQGKTLGIIGFGKIGKAVADIAFAFGMNVVANTNHPVPYGKVKFADKETVARESDFLTLHCPLNPQTTGMVDKEFLSKMKPTAMIINTSRGPVIDEEALAEALKNGVIAAAGLDVMKKEPPEKDNPLFGLENCTVTPHVAWAGYETRARLMEVVKENLRAYTEGKPQNLVY